MNHLVAIFAGDSGDGIQLLGNLFADNIASNLYDLHTFPDYPAEIRAPAGTIHGVSGFQIKWGNDKIFTSGEDADVLIAFNAAAFVKYHKKLKPNGLLIYDKSGFDAKNCKIANFDILQLETFDRKKIEIELSKICIDGLASFDMKMKEKAQNKNIFALGFLNFAIGSSIESTKHLIDLKFSKNSLQNEALKMSLQQGYNYADTIEFSFQQIENTTAVNLQGEYRNIQGNQAIALAILSAPAIFSRKVFFAGYPITPASDILHELVKYNLEELIVVQAEDEMASIGLTLGAAFGGAIGISATSGPGMDLKQETIGLAVSAELPILIIDVQRAGPSTGMPTKIEQSDLNLALNGRHGESPVPVVALKSTESTYKTTLFAIEIMIKHQTPVILLSDVLIANGSCPWKIPKIEDYVFEENETGDLARNENGVKPWKIPGEEHNQYITGGLEKDFDTGQISNDPINHQKMTQVRKNKIEAISNSLPLLILEPNSSTNGKLVVSWGSTHGVTTETLMELRKSNETKSLGHLHLEWIYPLPTNFDKMIEPFEQLIVLELNDGQLANYLKTKTTKNISQVNKIEGIPFFVSELKELILKA